MISRVIRTLVALLVASTVVAAEDDPFLWLEEVEGERALAWVAAQNERTLPVLEQVPQFGPIHERVRAILDSKDRIPAPAPMGSRIYNFWKDPEHERGIWRRTTLESYRSAEPEWETVLDLDAVAAAEGIAWAWQSASCLAPEYRRCMVALSRGGADAAVYREFDTVDKTFVEGGFTLPEAKSFLAWRDLDTLWVATDLGDGSLTESGYPRAVRLWRRGQSLAASTTVFEAEAGDVLAAPVTQVTSQGRYDLILRVISAFRQESFLVLDGRPVKLDLPEDAELDGLFKDHLLVTLRSDWTVGGATYPQGGLLAADLGAFLQGRRRFDVLFAPSGKVSLDGVATTRDRVVVSTLDNVRSRLLTFTLGEAGFVSGELELPGLGTANVLGASDDTDLFFIRYEDFLVPPTLLAVAGGRADRVKTSPAFFAADGMRVSQLEATSKDGTTVPYFMVTPAGFEPRGDSPTLLYGYGGFEISERPRYRADMGAAWLERGGVYVVANIRGGGEFGPSWHQAAIKENRMRSFEDFIAVAEELIRRRITSPRRLGIMGGSQGGLLVAGCMTLRPDLYRAVVSQVPLADMRRYHRLLAGASWMGEYGNPDLPEEWGFIRTWSPYHLLRADVDYPTPFFWTNTRDDRVHPAHARKMVARMLEQGHPVFYFENVEGGHGSGTVASQRAFTTALEYAYLWKMLS